MELTSFHGYLIDINSIKCITPVKKVANPSVTEYSFTFQVDNVCYIINDITNKSEMDDDFNSEVELSDIRNGLIRLIDKNKPKTHL